MLELVLFLSTLPVPLDGSYVAIDGFRYVVLYTHSLGKIAYPQDDAIGPRVLELPLDKEQRVTSWDHELLHACMHGHLHRYDSKQKLDDHLLREVYLEEDVIDKVSTCMIDYGSGEKDGFNSSRKAR